MKNLYFFVSIISLSVVLASCTKTTVSPSVSGASVSASTTGIAEITGTTGVTGTSGSATAIPITIVPIKNLQGNWVIVVDSTSFSGGVFPDRSSAYQGKPGDSFNFSAGGKLYINENALLDTPTYSIDNLYNITVIYADAEHFNESPGFVKFAFAGPGNGPPVSSYLTQQTVSANALILSSSTFTPDGVLKRIITLTR